MTTQEQRRGTKQWDLEKDVRLSSSLSASSRLSQTENEGTTLHAHINKPARTYTIQCKLPNILMYFYYMCMFLSLFLIIKMSTTMLQSCVQMMNISKWQRAFRQCLVGKTVYHTYNYYTQDLPLLLLCSMQTSKIILMNLRQGASLAHCLPTSILITSRTTMGLIMKIFTLTMKITIATTRTMKIMTVCHR